MRQVIFLLIAVGAASAPARAQQPAGAPAAATVQSSAPPAPQEKAHPKVHSFWDRDNAWLFAGVGASRALDYASTLNMRRRGRHEILLTDAVVDNHPLFAGIEAAGTAVSIGVSYLFHRTGHHKLERWTSIIHIGVATGGAVRNYALKSAPHGSPPVP
jgi:hypothetical protein